MLSVRADFMSGVGESCVDGVHIVGWAAGSCSAVIKEAKVTGKVNMELG